MDWFLIIWFCIECAIHIAAEGAHPQCYFFGRETDSWTTQARWNVFDFTVAYLSMVLATILTGAGESSVRVVVLLRLLRLLRLATILNKSPELTVIVAGFNSAVNNVFYILLVLVIIFYIFAILGFYLFSQNDPVRFGSAGMAMVTLLQCATLSQWDEVMYTQIYGCDVFPGTLYVDRSNFTVSPRSDFIDDDDALKALDAEGKIGKPRQPTAHGKRFGTMAGLMEPIFCDKPRPMPHIAELYFGTFTVLTSFVVLSLFVGVITLSMLEQMETHIRKKRAHGRAAELRAQLHVSLQHTQSTRKRIKDAIESRSARIGPPQRSPAAAAAAAAAETVAGQRGNGTGGWEEVKEEARVEKAGSSAGAEQDAGGGGFLEMTVLYDFTKTNKNGEDENEEEDEEGDYDDDDIEGDDDYDDEDYEEPLDDYNEENGWGLGGADESEEASLLRMEAGGAGLSTPSRRQSRRQSLERKEGAATEEEQRLQQKRRRRKRRRKLGRGRGIDSGVETFGLVSDRELMRGVLSELENLDVKERALEEKINRSGFSYLSTDEGKLESVTFELISDRPGEELACLTEILGGPKSASRRFYVETLAVKCKALSRSKEFELFVTLLVTLAALLVVLETVTNRRREPSFSPRVLGTMNIVVLLLFVLEVVVKLVGEGTAPLKYFDSSWNCFDATVVVLSLVALLSGGQNVSIIRIVRLLQIIKLTKRLRNLRVLIEALLTGLASVGYVMVLISVFNFILGIASINYFAANDGFHFGTVRDSMTSLYRIETLQAWEELLYVNMFGCDRYFTTATSPFNQDSCEEPFAAGFAVLPFFIFVVVFGEVIRLNHALLMLLICQGSLLMVCAFFGTYRITCDADTAGGGNYGRYQRVGSRDRGGARDRSARVGRGGSVPRRVRCPRSAPPAPIPAWRQHGRGRLGNHRPPRQPAQILVSARQIIEFFCDTMRCSCATH